MHLEDAYSLSQHWKSILVWPSVSSITVALNGSNVLTQQLKIMSFRITEKGIIDNIWTPF